MEARFLANSSLEQVRSKFSIDEKMEAFLPAMSQLISDNIEELVADFYSYITKESDVAHFFENETRLEILNNTNRRSFIASFTPPINRDYILWRLRIGHTHFKFQTPSVAYVASLMNLTKLLNRLWDKMDTKEQSDTAKNITAKIMSLEQYLAIEAFHIASQMALETAAINTSNLLRTLSHDIGNPLSAIKFVAEDSILSKNYEKSDSQIILRCVQKIEDISDGVRSLVAIESGKDQIKLETIYATDIQNDLEELFAFRYKKKQIELIFINEIPASTAITTSRSVVVSCILGNIISNSLKFSEKNTKVLVTFSVKNKNLRITIKDEGIGIPKAILEKLFDPNTVTSRGGTDGEEGTGFGMPLVKTYLEKLGGGIDVETQTAEEHHGSHGSLFTISFPIKCEALIKPKKAA